MSTNAKGRAAAGRGGRGYRKQRPVRKGFVSNHDDESMRKATFDVGQLGDATQYVKSMETFVGFIGRSGRNHTEELRSILIGDIDVLPTIQGPDKPEASVLKADDFGLEKAIYLEDRKSAIKKNDKLKLEIGQLYDEVWDQCSVELKANLKGDSGFSVIETARDPLGLRKHIKRACCGFEAHKMKYYALSQAVKKLTMFYQRPGMSNEEYKRQFDALWDMVIQFGGSVTNHPGLIKAEAEDLATKNGRANPSKDDREAATAEVENRMKACYMLGGASNDRFRSLKNHLENQYTMGVDQYPEDEEKLLGMMNNFRVGPSTAGGQYVQHAGDDDGLAFVQEGEEGDIEQTEEDEGVNAAQRRTFPPKQKANINLPTYPHKTKKCYHCNTMGHIAVDCPQLDETERGAINAQFGYTLLQKNNTVRTNYLYLDTCTTNNFMCNSAYLKDVHTAGKSLRLQTNAGSTSTDKQGYLGSTLMWLGRTGFANVITLRCLEELCRES